MDFKIGDWVVRKPLERGFPWSQYCDQFYKIASDKPLKITSISPGRSICFQGIDIAWLQKYFDKAFDPTTFSMEDYL